MRVRVRKVGTGSVFLLALVIYGAAGLVVGGLVVAATSLPLPEGYELTALDRLGPWALVVFPLVYGLAGGIFAALAAVLYNVAAAVMGGVRVEIPELDAERGPPSESEARTRSRTRSQPEAADAAGASEAGDASSAADEEPPSSRSSGE